MFCQLFHKLLLLVLFSLLLVTPLFISPTTISAATCNPAIVMGNPEVPENIFTGEDFEISVKMNTSIADKSDLVLLVTTDNSINSWEIPSEPISFNPSKMIADNQEVLTFKFKGANVVHPFTQYRMQLLSRASSPIAIGTLGYSEDKSSFKNVCGNMGVVKIREKAFEDIGTNCKVSLPDNIDVTKKEDFKLTYTVPDAKVFYAVLEGTPDKIKPTGNTLYYKATTMSLLKIALAVEGNYMAEVKPPSGSVDLNGLGITGFDKGKYRVALNAWVYRGSALGGYWHGFTCAHKDFEVTNKPTSAATEGKSIEPNKPINKAEPFKPDSCVDTEGCSIAAGDINQEKKCLNTAIGCVPLNLNSFVNGLLAWTAGIAGGVAFLLMIMGSLQMVTSQGNPEQLKKGREQFVAAISGLLFIIFSITLLQIIGLIYWVYRNFYDDDIL